MNIEPIYRTPEDYDLEHVGHTDDIEFFVDLAVRLKPSRVLELACGSGRVTVPLAEAGARHGFEVVGMELVPEMLEEARRKQDEAPPEVRSHLTLLEGDWEPSPAIRFHAGIYRARPDVESVIHTHSYWVSLFSTLRETIGMYNVVSVLFFEDQALYEDDGE